MEGASSPGIYRATAIVGTCLIGIGIAAGYIDVATHFRFQFISDQFSIFLLALLIGALASFVGLIGWAKQLPRGGRSHMARLVFVSPWVVGLLGYGIDGLNIHGPSALVLLLIVPASVLALVRIPRDGDQRSELMSITIPK
jgi:NO-binding membrane sensor protein with MHYT domain